jgi:hypothetical protein
MRTLFRVVGGFAVLQALSSGVAWAVCSCEGGTGTPEDRLESYDSVFVGRVVKGRPWGCGTDLGHTTHFEVTEAFKGVEVGDQVEVFHDTNSDECGLTFARSTPHLVYTNGTIDLCDPGGPIDETDREIEDLRDLTGQDEGDE